MEKSKFDNKHHKEEIFKIISDLETGKVSLDELSGYLQLIKMHVSYIEE